MLPYALLTVAALVLRLIDLGDRPFHHDESQDAYFSWLLLEHGEYAYNPLLHGPLRFYLTAAVYALVGASDFTARLAAGEPRLRPHAEPLARRAARARRPCHDCSDTL